MNDFLLLELTKEDNTRKLSKLDERLFEQDYVLCFIWETLLKLQHQAAYYNKQEYFQFNYKYLQNKFNVTNYKVSSCIDLLEEKGLLEIKRIKMPGRLHYKINSKLYKDLLEEVILSSRTSTKFSERENAVCTERENDLYNIKSKSKSESLKSDDNLLQKDVEDYQASGDAVEKTSLKPTLKRRNTSETLQNKEVEVVTKPTLKRRTLSIEEKYPEISLLRYWNNLSVNIPGHREDENSKVFQKVIKQLAKNLKKYTYNQIKQSMDCYHKLTLQDNIVIDQYMINHTPLVEFFEFSERSDKMLVKIDQFDGVNSYFEECLQGFDHVLQKFSKAPKCKPDNNPEVTKELARLYRENVNPAPLKPQEINLMITAASKLVDYHSNMRSKLRFNVNNAEKDSPRAFAHHMIDAILEKTPDKTIIQVNWLITDTQFTVRLPEHLKRLGMLDSDYRSSKADTISPEMLAKKKEEMDAVNAQFKADCKKIWESGKSDEEQKPILLQLQKKLEKDRADIIVKYNN